MVVANYYDDLITVFTGGHGSWQPLSSLKRGAGPGTRFAPRQKPHFGGSRARRAVNIRFGGGRAAGVTATSSMTTTWAMSPAFATAKLTSFALGAAREPASLPW